MVEVEEEEDKSGHTLTLGKKIPDPNLGDYGGYVPLHFAKEKDVASLLLKVCAYEGYASVFKVFFPLSLL